MFRLLKILFIAALLAGIYFYLQQTPFITTTWHRTGISQGISLAFPNSTRQHTRTITSSLFGKTRLDVYDFIADKEAYICLRIHPQYDKTLHKNLEQLFDDIRQLNDTAGMPITLKKQFIYRNYPAYEYHAAENGQRLWVRLLKVDGAILSLIYAVKGETLNERQAELFFNSLQL